jgi:hypothetical protein
MKRYVKIIALLPVFVLYGFIAVHYSSALAPYEMVSENHPAQGESSFSMVSADLDCHIIQTENSVRDFSRLPVPSLKNQVNVFLACTRLAELSRITSYSKYIFYANNSITWFRPVDIIFPFHYFW